MGNGAIYSKYRPSIPGQQNPPQVPKSPVSERSVHQSWGGSNATSRLRQISLQQTTAATLCSEESGKRISFSLPRVPSARDAVLAIKNVFNNETRVLVEHYLPPFCLMDPILSPEVGDTTRNTWDSIINGDAQGFRAMKEVHPHISALTYFYDRFYSQLFYLYPEVRPFFQQSITHQGRRLVKSMMGLATMVCYEKDKVDKKLIWLAHKHNEARIHPQYYGGFMWNILMTLRHCLGTDWTADVEEAWVISSSYMLRVMVPIAVQGTKHFASPYTTPKHNPEVFSSAGHEGNTGGGPKPTALGGAPPGAGLATIPDDNPLNGYSMPETHEYKDDPEEEKQKLFATPSLPSTPKAAGSCPVFNGDGKKGAPISVAQEIRKMSSIDSVEEAFNEGISTSKIKAKDGAAAVDDFEGCPFGHSSDIVAS